MTRPRTVRKPRPPLAFESLKELALAYVARFATSRGKLVRYLERKLRERGWEGEEASDDAIDRIANAIVELGYVDDSAFAASRARAFASRGLGPRRLAADLAAAGIDEEARDEAQDAMDAQAAALRFAERKRLGPFAVQAADPALHRKQFGAMIRAGHSFKVAQAILACAPGEEPDFS